MCGDFRGELRHRGARSEIVGRSRPNHQSAVGVDHFPGGRPGVDLAGVESGAGLIEGAADPVGRLGLNTADSTPGSLLAQRFR
jgi:hypothetical protein